MSKINKQKMYEGKTKKLQGVIKSSKVRNKPVVGHSMDNIVFENIKI